MARSGNSSVATTCGPCRPSPSGAMPRPGSRSTRTFWRSQVGSDFLVSAEALGHNRVRLFWRTRTGVEEEDVAHKPWVLIPSNEGHVLAPVKATQLEGEGYNRRIDF